MKKSPQNIVEDVFALTPMQEGMLYFHLKDPGHDPYGGQLSLDISGEMDVPLFRAAWIFVMETNEMLRVGYRWERVGEPVQIIFKEPRLKMGYFDLSDRHPREKMARLADIEAGDREEEFHLEEVPFRVTLVKVDKTGWRLVIGYHHILYDGWSQGVILKEFLETYRDLVDRKSPARPRKTRFKEFVKWIKGGDEASAEDFWRPYLAGLEGGTGLPVKMKKDRDSGPAGAGNYRIRISPSVKTRLEDFLSEHRLTLASLLYGGWGVLLHRYNNSRDAVFGTTVSGRNAQVKGIESMVGLFINTIPLRLQGRAGETISRLLAGTDFILKKRERFQHTPLVRIKEWCGCRADEEWFDSVVVMENYPLDEGLKGEIGGLAIRSYSRFEATHYPLTVIVSPFDDLVIDFSYRVGLFEKADIERLSRHFVTILEYMADFPGNRVDDIEILSAEEKKKILEDFNDTGAAFPREKVIHGLFQEQAARVPDGTALGFGHLQMTYGELNRRSRRWAGFLRGRGVRTGSTVAVLLERSPEMAAGILGILEAGAAYLPIEPGYPEERIGYVIRDSGTRWGLTRRRFLQNRDEAAGCEWMVPGDMTDRQGEERNCESGSASGDAAYVMYTSGSTGRPKGVVVEHGSVVNVLFSLFGAYPLERGDVYLFKTPFGFDVSVSELFGWFLGGGRLEILASGDERDPRQILEAVERFGVTHINFVPSLFRAFVEALEDSGGVGIGSLRYIFLAGEVLSVESVERFRALNKDILLENLYGPTEAAVYASGYSLEDWPGRGDIPIGGPLDNVGIYIVDGAGALQGVGMSGELCIFGAGLARGYLNRPELTAERFVGSRWVPGGRLYRTGDGARWLEDGHIGFLGRLDRQVKIRGNRVELEEIERRLLGHEAVEGAVVVLREDQNREGDGSLCAYVVSGRAFEPFELREYLAGELPGYMIPSFFVPIEEIPLTAGGKLDRSALPAVRLVGSADRTGPRDEIEAAVAEIWVEVLGLEGDSDAIDIDSGFFHLGGHSLKAVRMVSRVQKRLGRKLSLGDVFRHPTVRGISGLLRGAEGEGEGFVSLPLAEEREYYVLSSGQRRLYFLQQMDEGAVVYNIPFAVLVEGELERERLAGAFEKLISRHESLRTSFTAVAGEPVQRIHGEVEFEVAYLDAVSAAGVGPSPEERCGSMVGDFIRPFDLSRAPLVRVGLYRLAEEAHLLAVDMHHIVSDGTSVNILTRDFVRLYRGKELAPLEIQYKDFARWQDTQLRNGRLKLQEEYWLNHLSGELPVLDLPTDYPRPQFQGFAGDLVTFRLEGELWGKLNGLIAETGATLYMVLLAVLNVLLGKYADRQDIIVGTPTAGRNHPDLENIVGLLVENLAIRNRPTADKTFAGFLEEVKENTLMAYENQGYPYRELMKRLGAGNDLSRNPLFDVMLNVQNQERARLEMGELKVTPLAYESRVSRVDLLLEAAESAGGIDFVLEYCTDLFKRETVETFSGYFLNILEAVVNHPGLEISRIEMLGESTRERLLEGDGIEALSADFDFKERVS